MMPKRLTFQSVSAASPFSSSTISTTRTLSPASYIPATFTDGLPLPRLLVFDLDYTLWPFWVDTHVSTPVKPVSKDPNNNTAMVDRYGEHFAFYQEVPGILYAARQKGITMGLASRTCAPELAEKMLRNIIVPVPEILEDSNTGERERVREKPTKAWDFFTHREIYPGSKIKHFNRIQAATVGKPGKRAVAAGNGNSSEEVAFADMVFFDDEGRNREVETQLGVTFVLVRDGVTKEVVDSGVREWRKRWGIAANGKGKDEGTDSDDLATTE